MLSLLKQIFQKNTFIKPLNNASADKLALFIHGAGGTTSVFPPLAKALAPNYKAICHGLPFQPEFKANLGTENEEIAATYLDNLTEYFSSDSNLLCSYTGGGIIAYEMALQLEQRGIPVDALYLFETIPPYEAQDVDRLKFSYVDVVSRLLSAAGYMVGKPLNAISNLNPEMEMASLGEQKAYLTRSIAETNPKLSEKKLIWVVLYVLHNVAQFLARNRYYPKRKLKAPITLFRTQDPDYHKHLEETEDLGWSLHSEKTVNVVHCQGDHSTLLNGQHQQDTLALFSNKLI